jgi:hypothetical protein
MSPVIAPVLVKCAEAAVASAAVTVGKHIAEHPHEVLEAVGDVVIIKPIETATSAIKWFTDLIP